MEKSGITPIVQTFPRPQSRKLAFSCSLLRLVFYEEKPDWFSGKLLNGIGGFCCAGYLIMLSSDNISIVLSMMLLIVMEGSTTKYPAQQKPPVPVRMRGVFPDVVLVSPLPEEPTQAGEKADLQVLNRRRGECLDNLQM